MRSKTIDRKRPKGPAQIARAERNYAKQLSRLARQVGQIISAFHPGDPKAVPSIQQMLRSYAEALEPWAAVTAAKMIEEVNVRDLQAWRSISEELSAGIKREILTAPVGETLRKLQAEQVQLIKSIPLDAAERVHELTLKGIEDSSRAKEIEAEIMRSGDVSASRARLIARTETSRAANNLMESRARHVGSEGYIWRSAGDGDVRPSHKAMNGKFVAWSAPPTLDGMQGHAGCLPNCRCYSEPVLPE